MAKASFFHDTRAVAPGAEAPVKIRIYHHGKYVTLPTSIKVTSEQWVSNVIVNHPRAKKLNNVLALKMADVTSELLQLDLNGRLTDLSPDQLKKRLTSNNGCSSDDHHYFLPIYQEYMDRFDKPGTISIWQNTLNRISAYCEKHGYNLNRITFQDITAEWLENFDSFLSITAPKPNARAINHRNIRTVFNYALKRKKLPIAYPFEDFKIKHQETEHIDLTVEQIRLLAEYPLEEYHIRKYRDLFLLMLYLRGINGADLFSAMKDQVIDGRLEYYRKKTGAFCSVKIEPEAEMIIRKYAGEKYLIDIAERWTDPKNYLRKMDKGLKLIGPVTYGKKGKKTYHGLFRRISSNSARHTWGSLVYDLGYPMDVASEGLTHKYGSRTTNIYVHKRQRKLVDMANRELIDYISGKGE